jgi:purine nucleosidase
MERLIIDTDPGVDDALAIMMAAAYPGIEIVALTTVAGNVPLPHTLANACIIADKCNLAVPIYAGCDTAFVYPGADAAYAHGQDGLGNAGFPPSPRPIVPEHAALALLRLIHEAPGELTLVAIGPLTNIALALKLEPQLPHKLKRFVVMGGAVTGHGNTSNVTAEFNIYADPEAAHIVFSGWQQAACTLELVDWEATLRHGIDYETVNRWLELDTPSARFFQAFYAYTIGYVRDSLKRPSLSLADPLALAVVLEPEIVQRAEKRTVMVETSGHHTRGQTLVDWENRLQQPVNANIILEVNYSRFLQLVEMALNQGEVNYA